MAGLGLKDRKNFSAIYLNPALDAGIIERTIPDKPSSKNLRYRLTPFGKTIRARGEGVKG